MGSLGLELPTAVNFIIAFAFVLMLIAVAAWLVRRFGAARIEAAARGRQPRLAVVDSALVDGRRKLVIVRRDNVEHLLMIGGPTDVVVETNIVRGAASVGREPAASRNGVEAAPRIPLPDPAPWPQPEPAAPAAVASAPQPTAPAMPPSPMLRPIRPMVDQVWDEPEDLPPAVAPELRATRPPEVTVAPLEPAAPPQPAVQPQPVRVAAPPPPPPAPPVAAPPPAGPVVDQSLAEMAQRLEAALRRPGVAPAKAPAKPQQPAAPRQAQAPAPAAKSAQPALANLEQEMANLLNRPGKS